MILNVFRPAFSHQASSENFKVAVTGFPIEDEVNAITDLVRYFDYPEPDKLYERLISFLHASSYSITDRKWVASSKPCNKCGHKNSALQLHERTWTCPNCSAKHSRDEGLHILGLGEPFKLVKSVSVVETSYAVFCEARSPSAFSRWVSHSTLAMAARKTLFTPFDVYKCHVPTNRTDIRLHTVDRRRQPKVKLTCLFYLILFIRKI